MESLPEAFRQIRALTDRLDSMQRGELDAKNRRIVNMRPSVDQTDGVIRAELYQFLKKQNPEVNEITQAGDFSDPWAGRVLCSGVQSNGTDLLDPRYTVRLPANKKLIPQAAYIQCKTKPVLQDFVFWWTLSRDGDAVTFDNIFGGLDSEKLVIEIGQRFGVQLDFVIPEFYHNDILTINKSGSDGVVSGVEAVILWEMVSL